MYVSVVVVAVVVGSVRVLDAAIESERATAEAALEEEKEPRPRL
jgi:hypothetical protein